MNRENIEQAIQELEDAMEKASEAAYFMQQAQRLIKSEETGYNMSGNMSAYVINYLEGGVDCITDKIQKYIDQLQKILDNNPEEEEQV